MEISRKKISFKSKFKLGCNLKGNHKGKSNKLVSIRDNKVWTIVRHRLTQVTIFDISIPKAAKQQSAMSSPNGLLSQNICHYLDQVRTLNDMLLRSAL